MKTVVFFLLAIALFAGCSSERVTVPYAEPSHSVLCGAVPEQQAMFQLAEQHMACSEEYVDGQHVVTLGDPASPVMLSVFIGEYDSLAAEPRINVTDPAFVYELFHQLNRATLAPPRGWEDRPFGQRHLDMTLPTSYALCCLDRLLSSNRLEMRFRVRNDSELYIGETLLNVRCEGNMTHSPSKFILAWPGELQ